MSQWITKRTESSVRKNDQLHRILMENPNPENCVKTKEFHNEVTRMIRDAKSDNYNTLGENLFVGKDSLQNS